MNIKVEVTVYNPGCTVKIEAKGLPETMTGYLREDGEPVPEVQIDGVFFQVMEELTRDVINIIKNRELSSSQKSNLETTPNYNISKETIIEPDEVKVS
tara:strand:+ start:9057 stop:9350 length:294 start_codon:yes stop_codon:yes gene_type:complete